MDLDEVDRRLLAMLREDGRRPFVDVAKELGLSEAAVRRRVRKLVESGVIRRFTVELGRRGGASSITLISVQPGAKMEDLARDIKGLPGVERVYEITGQYDLAVFVNGESIAEVNSTIDRIRALPSVVTTNTIIILKED